MSPTLSPLPRAAPPPLFSLFFLFFSLISRTSLFSPPFSPFFLSSSHRRPHTETETERERQRSERAERERERAAVWKKRRREEKRGFWNAPSSRHLRLRSTIIRGPMKLKFCKEVHNTLISIVDGGDRIWSNLQSFSCT
jgi:hypothetical protein